MKERLAGLAAVMFVFCLFGIANATQIDFTGGTAYLVDGTTLTTNNSDTAWGTDYYVEDGFVIDFIGDGGIIGDYYSGNNDVIHGHWDTGDYGSLTAIQIFKEDGSTFDLNYFELTSNTDMGGGPASGNELAYITGYDEFGIKTGQVLLTSDDWGWDGQNPQIFLGSAFDNVSLVSFTVANAVDCFGMDMFYIDEKAPPSNSPVPEPASIFLFAIGIVSLAGTRLRKKK